MNIKKEISIMIFTSKFTHLLSTYYILLCVSNLKFTYELSKYSRQVNRRHSWNNIINVNIKFLIILFYEYKVKKIDYLTYIIQFVLAFFY